MDFDLPPPAMNQRPASKIEQASPPASPQDAFKPAHKRTLSGARKSKEDLTQVDLPPPPSRARKIIQMKPKANSTSSSEATAQSAAPSKPAGKRKQPSATSAAGRKIARKTAHSIIERRRRSKMNEEFGVLKDMIPACAGVEMHKLAILQAGIEYVRYLEGCIKQLKGEKEERPSPPLPRTHYSDDDEDEEEQSEDEEDFPVKRTATNSSTDWQYRKPSIATTASSSNPSPNILPQPRQTSHRPVLPSINAFAASPALSSTPTPTKLSPAFNAIHFSPDLARSATSSVNSNLSIINASPNILPLPQAMIAMDRKDNASPMSEGRAEATATAALMMLTHDRRAMEESRGKGKGMSVKDLLTS